MDGVRGLGFSEGVEKPDLVDNFRVSLYFGGLAVCLPVSSAGVTTASCSTAAWLVAAGASSWYPHPPASTTSSLPL